MVFHFYEDIKVFFCSAGASVVATVQGVWPSQVPPHPTPRRWECDTYLEFCLSTDSIVLAHLKFELTTHSEEKPLLATGKWFSILR